LKIESRLVFWCSVGRYANRGIARTDTVITHLEAGDASSHIHDTFDSIDLPPIYSNFLVFYHCLLAVVLMPIVAKNSTKRASSNALSRPKKRARGTASQPIPINSQAPALSPSLPLPIINAL
jgi:hypothetical protein